MTNFEYVQATIDLFESSLETGAPICTVGALSARIGYSAHHLARMFQALCEENLGRYMQHRRLAAAACAIRLENMSAKEAAHRYGWEDYSGFARAVRSTFKTNPAGIKTSTAESLRLATRARPRIPENVCPALAAPEHLVTKAIHVSGPVFYMGPNERSFHRPWRIFMRNQELIRGIIGKDSWQFSSWDDKAPDEDDGMWIHCAMQTDPSVTQDLRFFSRTIPEMTILAFNHSGPIETIHNTYRQIWGEFLPASDYQLAGNFEFQHYTHAGEVRICLPVKE